MNNNVLSVSQVSNYISAIFNAEELLHNIAICGEVYNFSVKGSYAFFSLKDDNSTISCSCFSLTGSYVPKDGEKVLAVGSVSYYSKGGRLTFIVKKISALGQGALAERFEKIKEQLIKEGIFDQSHKKAIPKFPLKIGVVTSKSGAVIHDIERTVHKNNPFTDVYVVDVRVQGESAPNEIIKALKFADTLDFDVIIIARGGGSFEDLLPFYDEQLARTIYYVNTPIISAVGHETDVTFCDFASDLRVPTPTAAGEAASFNYKDTVCAVKNSLEFISAKCENAIISSFERLNHSVDKILGSSKLFILKNEAKLKNTLLKISNFASITIGNKEHILDNLTVKLSALNPISLLNKGAYYAYKDGKPLHSIKIGDKLSLYGKEYDFDVTVDKIYNKQV